MKSGLPHSHGLTSFVLESAELLPKDAGQPLLTDAQYDALEAGVASGCSVLVSAPTSTGKTLIGWWAISGAIALGGRAVYLVSHRALAKQKFEEAQRLFLNGPLAGDHSTIVCATGDGVEDASGRRTSSPLAASILIATYEKFLGSLSVGGPPRDLTDTTFVCDEIQLLGDLHRGQNVELLLTLLKRSGWRQFVGLSAVLDQRDASSIVNWLGIDLVRSPVREKALRLECRGPQSIYTTVIGPERAENLPSQLQRKTTVTNQIVSELLSSARQDPVIVFCMKIDDTYDLCNAWVRGKSVQENVAPLDGSELDAALRDALERRAAFHNAELGEDERLLVEDRLKQGMIDVVYATTTLAAGVNFPLSCAVFASWVRWNFERRQHEPISRAEFHSMAGRVGRMGQSALEGSVILTAENQIGLQRAVKLMDFSIQDELGIGITPDDFHSLTLQLFAGKLATSRQEAFELLKSTLSASREIARNVSGVENWKDHLNNQIDRLIAAECIIESRGRIVVTTFGRAVARSGLKADTALYFINSLSKSAAALAGMLARQGHPGSEDDLLFIVAHGALTSPEFNYEGGKLTRTVPWRVSRPNLASNDYARRLDQYLWSRPWTADVSAANGALLVADWASGLARAGIESRVSGVRLGTVESLARDVGWILSGISEIVVEITSPTLADESKPEILRGFDQNIQNIRQLSRALRRMSMRVAVGLGSDVLWMTELELLGIRRRLSRSQIISLRFHGLIRPQDLMDGGPDADTKRRLALPASTGAALANQVRDATRNWKKKGRDYYRAAHLKRGAKHGIEVVVDALYAARGIAFEASFQDAMDLLSIDCEKLDRGAKQAYPDFLITIENYTPIVFELKTRDSDNDLISLNLATEVLSASEMAGLRDNFCVTLCNPGVEPSVPGAIERCQRLSVLELTSLVEALLRLREGTLTREQLYNWLTTPGLAAMEELPTPS